jgi:hypothetical protein
MCLIIDASVAADAFVSPSDQDSAPVIAWLEKGGMLVIGGKLTRELNKVASAQRMLLQYVRAGIAREVSSSAIDAEIAKIKSIERPKSNDIHIVALARAARARLLYSNDGPLIEDFKNLRFVSEPKGKVYKNATHKKLLREAPKCIFAK